MSPSGNSLFTAPNLLSLSRLPLGWLFWVVLGETPERGALALGVMALAALTDVLDGTLARRRGADTSGTGSWLDPICDKLFVGAVLAGLHFERGVPLWLLAIIVLRELLQLPMVVVYRVSPTLRQWLRYDFRASPLGKAATVLQFAAIAALVLGNIPAKPLAFCASALGVIALGDYVRRAIAIGRGRLHESRETPSKPHAGPKEDEAK
jgi:phosphatidylglycerophosphate synthase